MKLTTMLVAGLCVLVSAEEICGTCWGGNKYCDVAGAYCECFGGTCGGHLRCPGGCAWYPGENDGWAVC
ncbi:hypothetical protein VUR80DRAFT_8578 [Thermomyces stellatus]